MQLIATQDLSVEGRAVKSGETFTVTPALGEALVKAGAAKPAKKS